MKRLNPYLTGGITPDWIDYLLAFQEAGADAVEIGLPFSDPMLDGATIQQASDQALRRGVTVGSILADLAAARDRIHIPLIAMTYANLVFRDTTPAAAAPAAPRDESFGGQPAPAALSGQQAAGAPSGQPAAGTVGGQPAPAAPSGQQAAGAPSGQPAAGTVGGQPARGALGGRSAAGAVSGGAGGGPEVFCRRLADAGISGLIVPDVPIDEAGRLEAAAAAAGIELVLLAAPVTPPERLAEIGRHSRGFVYAVSVMDTTGERDSLAASAAPLARRIKAVTGLPVLIGFGISTPAQAATAARAGDGVVIGAALMRRVLDGASPDDLRAEVAAFRAALDQVDQEMPVARAHAEVPGDR